MAALERTRRDRATGSAARSAAASLLVTVKDEQSMMGLGAVSFSERQGVMVGMSGEPANAVHRHVRIHEPRDRRAHADGAHPVTRRSVHRADVTGPTGCCGFGPDSNATVLLAAVDAKMLCTSTGGMVDMALCCSALPFPDFCGAGACSCSPQSSVMAEVCQCPMNQCFDPEVGCKMR
jgi:hypothetical protein